jgi:hypothetical protein
MRKLVLYFCAFCTCSAFAEDFDMNYALRDVYMNCAGIEDSLQEMKKLAGINTAITAVGTGTGVGAVATGVAKKNTDVAAETIEIKLEKLRKIEAQNPGMTANQDYSKFIDSMPSDMDAEAVLTKYSSLSEAIEKEEKELEKLTEQSTKLGNWRTGLLAGTTATGIAGTVVAAKNRVNEDLISQINNCITSIDALREAFTANKVMGNDTFDAQEIITACGDYKFIDLSKINKRANGALVSSALATTTGVTGTIVSAVANSKNVRNDNTESGKQKEKDLNTSSNVLAVGATAASASAAVFNGLQIAEIKKVISVAEKCSGVLK